MHRWQLMHKLKLKWQHYVDNIRELWQLNALLQRVAADTDDAFLVVKFELTHWEIFQLRVSYYCIIYLRKYNVCSPDWDWLTQLLQPIECSKRFHFRENWKLIDGRPFAMTNLWCFNHWQDWLSTVQVCTRLSNAIWNVFPVQLYFFVVKSIKGVWQQG